MRWNLHSTTDVLAGISALIVLGCALLSPQRRDRHLFTPCRRKAHTLLTVGTGAHWFIETQGGRPRDTHVQGHTRSPQPIEPGRQPGMLPWSEFSPTTHWKQLPNLPTLLLLNHPRTPGKLPEGAGRERVW